MTETTLDQHTAFADKAAQLKALVDDITSDAPAYARQLASNAKAKARQAVDVVRRHPVEAAVVAVGAGLLAWYLISRRSSAT